MDYSPVSLTFISVSDYTKALDSADMNNDTRKVLAILFFAEKPIAKGDIEEKIGKGSELPNGYLGKFYRSLYAVLKDKLPADYNSYDTEHWNDLHEQSRGDSDFRNSIAIRYSHPAGEPNSIYYLLRPELKDALLQKYGEETIRGWR